MLSKLLLRGTLHLQDQNRNHKLLWLIGLAYLCKYAYALKINGHLFFDDDVNRDFYPWFSPEAQNEMGIKVQTQYNYVYLIGERLWQAMMMSAFHWYAGFYITWFLMAYHTAYVFDFLIFFHATPFGTVCMATLAVLFLPLFIKWMIS